MPSPNRVNFTLSSTFDGSIALSAIVAHTRNSGGTPVSKMANSIAKSPFLSIRPRLGPFSGSASSTFCSETAKLEKLALKPTKHSVPISVNILNVDLMGYFSLLVLLKGALEALLMATRDVPVNRSISILFKCAF